MAVYEVYRHPEYRRYRTSLCSKATIFVIVVYFITIFGPLLVAFRSQGFWQRTDTYFEQPKINFKHKIIAIIETVNQQAPDYLIWSTYQNLNTMMQSHLRIPLLKSHEEDTNRDGVNDMLYLDMEIPMLDSEDVHSIKLLLFFQYKLQKMSLVTMETMAYIHHSAFSAGAQFVVQGPLRLQQVAPLLHTGTDNTYAAAIVNDSSIFPQEFNLTNILSSYQSRNLTTWFDNKYPVWISGRGAGQPFSVKAIITYPVEEILYYTGFWQLIKWAWVQYVSILVAFVFVFERLQLFAFSNQLFSAAVVRPFKVKL